MRVFVKPIAAAAACATILSFGQASAEEQKLFLTTMSPVNSDNVVSFYAPFAKRFNEAGNGVVSIELKYGFNIANFRNIYSRVKNDVVQVGWAVMHYLAGEFPLSQVTSLPSLYTDNVVASKAWWKLYKSGALDSEMANIVPLWVAVSTPGALHARNEIKSLETLHGLKIGARSKNDIEIVKLLGGLPISMSSPELYESIQRGTIDGGIVGWSGVGVYKLDEVTKFHVNLPLGGGAHMLFMTRSKYNSLSAKARKIIDDNTGERMVMEFANMFLRQTKEISSQLANTLGQTVVDMPASAVAQWQNRLAPIVDKWVKDVPGRDKVLAEYRRFIAEADKE